MVRTMTYAVAAITTLALATACAKPGGDSASLPSGCAQETIGSEPVLDSSCVHNAAYMRAFVARFDTTFVPLDGTVSPDRWCLGTHTDQTPWTPEDCTLAIQARTDLRQNVPDSAAQTNPRWVGAKRYGGRRLIARGINLGSMEDHATHWPAYSRVYLFATSEDTNYTHGQTSRRGYKLYEYYMSADGKAGWIHETADSDGRKMHPVKMFYACNHASGDTVRTVSFGSNCDHVAGVHPRPERLLNWIVEPRPDKQGTNPPWFACGQDCCMVDNEQ